MFSSPAGVLPAINVISSANPGVGTLKAVWPPSLAEPFAALGQPLGRFPSQPKAISPYLHSRIKQRQRPASTVSPSGNLGQRPQRQPNGLTPQLTAPTAGTMGPLTTAAHGSILDNRRTQRVRFAHTFPGICRRLGSCQCQHEPVLEE